MESGSGLSSLGIDVKLFFAQLLHFIIVLLIFWRWIYRPIQRALDQRRQTIQKGIEDASAAEVALSQAKEKGDELRREARGQSKQIMTEAHDRAEAERTRLIEQAKADVAAVVEEGKRRLQDEQRAMMRESKKELASLAALAARRVLEDSVDEKTAHKTAEAAIGKALGL